MALPILRFLGERVLHKTVSEHTRFGGVMDVKLGFQMLKDKRVPLKPKLMAIGIGAALMALLIGLELPLEWFIAIVLPFVGLLVGTLTDTMEAIIGTLGVAALLVPHFAPKPLTLLMRNERHGIIEEPQAQAVIEAQPTPQVVAMPASYDLSPQTPALLIPKR